MIRKRLIKVLMILAVAMGVFKMLDRDIYTRTKPLIESLEIYNKEDTDTYYLVFKFDKYMKELEGSQVYLHGRPIESELKLLPKQRQKHKFDNWDFKLGEVKNDTFVRTVNSKAKNLTTLSFGIYKTPNGELIGGGDRKVGILKDIDLSKATDIEELKLDKLEKTGLNFSRKDIKTFGYYEKKEIAPSKIIIIFLTLLAMATCIVRYVMEIIEKEYKSKDDILGILTLTIVGIYPVFINLKSGAIATIIDILLVLLIIGLFLRKKIERKNIKIYLLMLLMIAWWWYATRTGLDQKIGMNWYKGIIIKYLWLPIGLSLIKIDRDKIKRIWTIYLLSTIPYFLSFIDKVNLTRLGDANKAQRMSVIAASIGVLLLTYLLFEKFDIKLKILYLFIIIFLSWFIGLSGVRGIWICYFPLLVALKIVKERKKGLIVLVILIVGGLLYIKSNPNNQYVKRVYSITEGKNDFSYRTRTKMWSMVSEIILNNPVKGIGIGGFKRYTMENEGLKERKKWLEKNLNNQDDSQNQKEYKQDLYDVNWYLKGPSHTHNTFLETLTSTGIVGFTLYTGIILFISIRFLKNAICARDKFDKLVFVSFLLVLAINMGYGMTEYILRFEGSQQSLWFFMGLLLNYQFIKKVKS